MIEMVNFYRSKLCPTQPIKASQFRPIHLLRPKPRRDHSHVAVDRCGLAMLKLSEKERQRGDFFHTQDGLLDAFKRLEDEAIAMRLGLFRDVLLKTD